MPFPIIPVLGGLLGGASLWSESNNAQLAAQVSRENTDKTIAANKEMAQYAYQRDIAMWERANAYNSPSAQMDRLRQAGLNPMLIYGTGSAGASGNTGTTMPKYQAPNQEYKYVAPTPNFSGVLGQYQNMAMMQAQVDNVRAQTNATNQKTANDALTNVILAAQAGVSGEMSRLGVKRLAGEAESADVAGRYAQRLRELEMAKGTSEADILRVSAKYAEKLRAQEAQRGDVGIQREKVALQSDAFSLSQRRSLGPYDLAVRQYEAAKAKADAQLAAGSLDVQAAQLKQLGLSSRSLELQNFFAELKNEFAKRGYNIDEKGLWSYVRNSMIRSTNSYEATRDQFGEWIKEQFSRDYPGGRVGGSTPYDRAQDSVRVRRMREMERQRRNR